jgi:hypothetical protein
VNHTNFLERRDQPVRTDNSSTVVARFTNRDDADLGMTRLLIVGFRPEHIGLLEPKDAFKTPGQVLVSAEAADVEAATTAAAVFGDSNAMKVYSPVAPMQLPLRHPSSSEEAA